MAGDDERGGSLVERWVMTKFALSFVAVVSFFSFLYSYFSGLWSYNIQLSTLVFSLFAHSVDRKYMFLICNGIVAFLVKNMTFSSSSSSSEVIMSAEDSDKRVGEVLVQENVAEYVEEEETEKQQQEMKVQDEDEDKDKVEEIIVEEKVMEVEEKVEDESEEEEDEEEEEVEVEVEENKGREDEVISDASVSTEELNHKFEEFIRKMKEEIRIEAQQQQQLVAAS